MKYFVVLDHVRARFLLCRHEDYEQPGREAMVVAEFAGGMEAWKACKALNAPMAPSSVDSPK